MRVVFVTHNYPRSTSDVAGGFLHPLAVALRARDVDVQVVAPSDRGQGGTTKLDGVPVHRMRYAAPEHETLAYTGTMAEALRSPRGLRALASMTSTLRSEANRLALASHTPVVMHAHWWVPAGISLPRDVPAVVTCHGSDVRLLARGGVFQWLGRRVLRRAAVVTTVSRPFASIITSEVGVAFTDDTIQPMPVADVPRRLSTGGGGLVVVGRLVPQKRVELGIRAYAALVARGYALPLTIVGDGASASLLVNLAQSLGVAERVRFTGAMAPAAVPEVFATADCCLMTAHDEGLGLVAAEALMQGVPVVACTDGGGVLDVVPVDGGGRIVAPDPGAIADAVESLAAAPDAGPAAAALGAEWAVRLSPEHVAERAMGWYRRALDA